MKKPLFFWGVDSLSLAFLWDEWVLAHLKETASNSGSLFL
jgi:hypothetical protein